MSTRGRRQHLLPLSSRKENDVKVVIGKRLKGTSDILVVPSRRSKRPPVLVKDVSPSRVREVVRGLVTDLEDPK